VVEVLTDPGVGADLGDVHFEREGGRMCEGDGPGLAVINMVIFLL